MSGASRAQKALHVSSGVAQWLACWAHNPKVRGSKPRSAMFSQISAAPLKLIPHSSSQGDAVKHSSGTDAFNGHRSHFGSRYKLGCCSNASLLHKAAKYYTSLTMCVSASSASALYTQSIVFPVSQVKLLGLAPVALRGHDGEVSVNTLSPASHVDGLP